MRNQKIIISKKYLSKFDEILFEMCNKMTTTKVTNNITINFIESIIPHHKSGIQMCENLLQYTYYKPLQEIAQNIIKMQSAKIEQMEEIARASTNFLNYQKNVNSYIEKNSSITEDMICRMKNSPRGIDINLNFVNEMIPYHEGVIAMSQNVLQYCIAPKLKNTAECSIKEQCECVKKLKLISY